MRPIYITALKLFTEILSLATFTSARPAEVIDTSAHLDGNTYFQQINDSIDIHKLVKSSDFPVVIQTRGFGNSLGSTAFQKFAEQQNGQFSFIKSDCQELEERYGHDQLLYFAFGPDHRAISYHGDGSVEDIHNWINGVQSASIESGNERVHFNF